MKTKMSPIKYILLAALCFLWAFPLLWAVVTAFRPSNLATGFSLTPSFTLDNIREVFGAAPFVKYGLNTVIIVFGILGVQLVTVTLGAYALARVDFAGKGLAMALIMMQIIIPADILILPNYQTLKAVNLIDSRLGVMVPYFASSMGLLLLRQAFKSVPSAIVDAARMDGATVLQTLRYIFIPCSKAAYISFAICSISTHLQIPAKTCCGHRLHRTAARWHCRSCPWHSCSLSGGPGHPAAAYLPHERPDACPDA